jgi:hypothetical protein
MKRFKVGDNVWVSPQTHTSTLIDDEGVITEVFDWGYLVYQENEPRVSHGEGWCAHDNEISEL